MQHRSLSLNSEEALLEAIQRHYSSTTQALEEINIHLKKINPYQSPFKEIAETRLKTAIMCDNADQTYIAASIANRFGIPPANFYLATQQTKHAAAAKLFQFIMEQTEIMQFIYDAIKNNSYKETYHFAQILVNNYGTDLTPLYEHAVKEKCHIASIALSKIIDPDLKEEPVTHQIKDKKPSLSEYFELCSILGIEKKIPERTWHHFSSPTYFKPSQPTPIIHTNKMAEQSYYYSTVRPTDLR